MQEKHKTLGCTLVVTQNHLITLREDFSSPLRKLKSHDEKEQAAETSNSKAAKTEDDFNHYLPETGSLVSLTSAINVVNMSLKFLYSIICFSK